MLLLLEMQVGIGETETNTRLSAKNQVEEISLTGVSPLRDISYTMICPFGQLGIAMGIDDRGRLVTSRS